MQEVEAARARPASRRPPAIFLPPLRVRDRADRSHRHGEPRKGGHGLHRSRGAGDAARHRARPDSRRTPRPQPPGRLRADRAGRRGDRRGLPPRRRLAARRGRGAGRGRRPGPRCDRGGHPGALQPHRPDGTLLAVAGRRRGTPGRLRPGRHQPGGTRGGGDAGGGRGRGGARAARGRGPCGQPGVDVRRRPPAAVRDLEVRHHPRRAQRRGRRHQPLGQQPCRPTRHPPPAWPGRHDAGRQQHRGRRRPRAHRPRRARPAPPAPAAARGDGGAGPAHDEAGLQRPGRDAAPAHARPARGAGRALRPRPAARLPRGRPHPGRRLPACRAGRRDRRVRRPDAARLRAECGGRPRH